jgi:hypothetical protein
MAHFGFRTGELRLLKYKDVVVHSDDTATVTIQQETTKVRNKRVVRGRRGDIFARRKEYSKFIEPDDFVFSHYRKRDVITKELLYDYFNELKKYTKKLHDDFDESVDIYDLRHLWITIQLTIGKIDVYTISKYAGTSIAQIQNHYDHVQDTHVSNQVLSYNYELKKDIENQIVLVDLSDAEMKEKRKLEKEQKNKERVERRRNKETASNDIASSDVLIANPVQNLNTRAKSTPTAQKTTKKPAVTKKVASKTALSKTKST